jgi:hypothetical protein
MPAAADDPLPSPQDQSCSPRQPRFQLPVRLLYTPALPTNRPNPSYCLSTCCPVSYACLRRGMEVAPHALGPPPLPPLLPWLGVGPHPFCMDGLLCLPPHPAPYKPVPLTRLPSCLPPAAGH